MSQGREQTALLERAEPVGHGSSRTMAGGRGLVVIVLVLALLATAGLRQWADGMRLGATNIGGQPLVISSGKSLSGMPSFALALLLGGLRGPLVMVLWTSSESQKTEKNLEDFDTKVEWIRLLQPEFDSVHIFQIWNKAYNISVQMASLANKYTTILDALDYARKVDAERPNNIDICFTVADSLYFNKLGTSAEKEYYRQRVREDTKWRALPARPEDWRKTRLDPMLDRDGNILPELLKPTALRPTRLSPDARWNDGSELQYLKQYQPFNYGLSPLALAFNYYQKAQVMQKQGGQRHIQVSGSVLDSRPAVALEFWGTEEQERGRRLEMKLLGLPIPDSEHRLEMELGSATAPLDGKFKDVSVLPELEYSYWVAARLMQDSAAEYKRHLLEEEYQAANIFTYQSHMLHADGIDKLLRGDLAYIQATQLPGQLRPAMLKSAGTAYRQAIRVFQEIILKHYVAAELTTQLGVNKAEVEKLSDERLGQVMEQVRKALASGTAGFDSNREERDEYEKYISRATTRIKTCEQTGG